MSNLECIRAYKDLCKEIDALTIRKDELTDELRILNRRIMSAGPRTKLVASYLGMPGGGSGDLPIEQQWDVYRAVQEAIEDVSDILSVKLEAKARMERTIAELDRLDYRVAYMRDIERKPIAKIAMELGYSYDWICKISGKTKRLRKAG